MKVVLVRTSLHLVHCPRTPLEIGPHAAWPIGFGGKTRRSTTGPRFFLGSPRHLSGWFCRIFNHTAAPLVPTPVQLLHRPRTPLEIGPHAAWPIGFGGKTRRSTTGTAFPLRIGPHAAWPIGFGGKTRRSATGTAFLLGRPQHLSGWFCRRRSDIMVLFHYTTVPLVMSLNYILLPYKLWVCLASCPK